MTSPVFIHEVDDEMRQQFNHLMEAMEDIVAVDPDREEGSYEALNQRIHQQVTDQPNLSRVVSERQCQSLLSAAVSNLNLATSQRVIKCLIQANPTALLWLPTADAYDVAYHERNSTIPIYMIVRHPVHCLLMPWIITHYPWVLDHEYCLERSPVFELLDMYTDRSNNNCGAATIKQFFEAYPRAFHMEDSHVYRYGYPVHRILRLQECGVDLFKWIAERCPGSLLLETNSDGYTPLHLACKLLRECLEDHPVEIQAVMDLSEICKYLIDKCPDSVCIVSSRSSDEDLPIHFLLPYCGHRVAREVVVCLLRVYPKSANIKRWLSVRYSPFIRSIKPHLDKEKELKETAVSLTYTASSFTKAVTCTKDKLMRSSSTVYDSWATSFVNTTEDNLKLISVKLQDICNEGIDLSA